MLSKQRKKLAENIFDVLKDVVSAQLESPDSGLSVSGILGEVKSASSDPMKGLTHLNSFFFSYYT